MNEQADNPWGQWQEAAKHERIDAEVRALYADIGEAVAERAPLCNASGRCCKFDTYGHRLYVTGLEIAWFLSGVTKAKADAISASASPDRSLSLHVLESAPQQDACPYQVDGLCSTHAIRPLGCRVYFCEQGTEGWQQDTTELFLNRLKQLHAEYSLPYVYMEWRHGLAEASQALAPSP